MTAFKTATNTVGGIAFGLIELYAVALAAVAGGGVRGGNRGC